MNHSTTGLLLLACGLVVGCGGTFDGSADASRFDELSERADGLLNEVGNLSFTDPAALPTSGAATYEGTIGLNVASIPDTNLQGYDLIGDLRLTANFAGAGDPVTGLADGFVGVDDDAHAGTLIVDDGVIDRLADPMTGDTLTADMAGVLTDADGTAWTIEAALAGDFAGEDQSHVFGVVLGEGCTSIDCSLVTGGFAAER